jgi:hypothetical protein
MSAFFAGFATGLSDELRRQDEIKLAKQQRQEELDLRRQEREEERAFQRQMFQEKILESRRDTLFQLLGERKKSSAEAASYVSKAQGLVKRFEGLEDDPRLNAILSNPVAAAALEDQLYEIEKKRAESDLDLPPLSGAALLDMITVETPQGFVPVEISVDDILSMDVGDRAAYEGAILDLSRTAPSAEVRLSPEAYRRIDPNTLKEGRAAFDQEVIRMANQALSSVSKDPEAFTRLNKLIEDAGKEGSPGMIALRDMFGAQALSALQALDSPYIQNLQQDPQLDRYFKILELSRIANDPSYSEEDRLRAQELMQRLQGGI